MDGDIEKSVTLVRVEVCIFGGNRVWGAELADRRRNGGGPDANADSTTNHVEHVRVLDISSVSVANRIGWLSGSKVSPRSFLSGGLEIREA